MGPNQPILEIDSTPQPRSTMALANSLERPTDATHMRAAGPSAVAAPNPFVSRHDSNRAAEPCVAHAAQQVRMPSACLNAAVGIGLDHPTVLSVSGWERRDMRDSSS
jgi:hypothetical protein